MPFTFGIFKSLIRAQIFPDGEQSNLIISHDKSFIDALIDIQTWVSCAQQNNTSLFPHCSTFYRCGLTVIDSAPRGIINSVSVIDKINSTTGLEDATVADDWCSEAGYTQVDACHVHAYLNNSNRRGCCLPIPLFFGIAGCSKGLFPIPTDAGVPAGLPVLPLGFHYPQTSTDRTWGRAGSGIWAMERGQIFIAPWINSTETVVIKWDGIKRDWNDVDPIDSDPLLSKAVRLYVQSQHAGEWDHEFHDKGNFQTEYIEARAMLIHQCREETRARMECGGQDESSSTARSISTSTGVTDLFYNDDQSTSVSCPAGTTGAPVSITIPAGTVGSAISKADANQKAAAQAQLQATQQLVCTTPIVVYSNDAQTFTASCTGMPGSPMPEGTPVTVTVKAGEITSTVSKDAANAAALALAQSRAQAELVCTFWNKAVTINKTCMSDGSITATATVAAHTYSSKLSQAAADAQAITAATNAVNQSLTDQGCTDSFVKNTEQSAIKGTICRYDNNFEHGYTVTHCEEFVGPGTPFPHCCSIEVKVTVPANTFSAPTQAEANQMALDAAAANAQDTANILCRHSTCATYNCYGVVNTGGGVGGIGCMVHKEYIYPAILPY